MDLCADQLLANLPDGITRVDIAPEFRQFCSHFPFPRRLSFNADRLVNRHILLPRVVRRAARNADYVHIVDHSYAHLVRAVPPGHAGVYCHDLDAFRSILEPEQDPRPWWFRRLAHRTLDGLKRAAIVFHSTAEVGRRLATGIVNPERLVYAPYGVATEFTSQATAPVELPVSIHSPFLLHVGSNIPRKRLDVLLDVFAEVRRHAASLRLVQVGGPWPPHLAEQINRLGIGEAVTQVRNLTREQLAELYRRTAVVLVPSEAEGFGLPVIEALACGAVVIASDISTLREAGGAVVDYCAVADVAGWVEAATRVVNGSPSTRDRAARLAHAARFSWREHARIIGESYLRLASQR
ncbi:MAG: glycosyltransferase [Planctomycetes bacterium]|nr:glycosyltransferase [Planctomycetota bacterium]